MDRIRDLFNREDEPNGDDELDGCALDFTKEPVSDLDVENMLVPEGEEEDELDEEGEPATPSSPDKGLATRLRRAAVILGDEGPLFKVREVDGWKTRGRTTQGEFKPKGSVNHHTAGAPPSAGNAPSLGIVVNGRADLPGPLANVLQAYDDTAIVVAAGVANHAGSGGWKGITGNSSVYGLEVEHPGTSRVGEKRVLVMASIHAAFLWRPQGEDIEPRMVSQHREWSTAGKIDFARNFVTDREADEFRALVKKQLAKLNAVWQVSFLDAKDERQEAPTRNPAEWVEGHMAAMRRGVVRFDPK